MLKQTALATLIAASVLAAPALYADAGKHEQVSEQRQTGAFTSIDLSGPYNVMIKAQGKNALSLTGTRDQLADVETVVSGDTLMVRPLRRNGFFFGFGKKSDQVTLHITAATLASLKMSGSGDVTLEQVSGDKFSVSADGPGDLHGAGAVRELVVDSRGPGDLDLQQLKAARVNLKMTGPGDVQLSGISGELAAEVRGPGDLIANQLEAQQVRLLMKGPGDVELAGSTVVLDAEIDGPGDLEADRLRAKNATLRSRGPGDVALSTVGDTLDAELRGPGSLKAGIAGKRLLLKMSGPGDAEIDGSVDAVNAQLSGPGSLDARRLLAGHADVVVRGPGTAVVNVRAKLGDKTAMLEKSRLVTIDRRGAHQSGE